MPAVTAATIALDVPTKALDWDIPGSGGSIMGRSTGALISFFGATPVAQRATGNNTALTTGATTTVQLAVLTEIQTTLVNLGLMPST